MGQLKANNTIDYHEYYNLDDVINITDLDRDKILVHEKQCLCLLYYQGQNKFVYYVKYKTPFSEKPMHISFFVVIRYIKKRIPYYSLLMKLRKKYLIELNILLVKKVTLQLFIVTTT